MTDHTWASEGEVRSEFQERTPLATDAAIIIAAHKLGDEDAKSVLDALNTIWGHGFSDESSGSMDAPCGHFFRVEHWIVMTDSRGFSKVHTYGSIGDAMVEFSRLDREYAAWMDDEE